MVGETFVFHQQISGYICVPRVAVDQRMTRSHSEEQQNLLRRVRVELLK